MSFYHKNLGLAYYHLEQYEEAMTMYDRAIGYNGDNADNYFNRGNVYQQQKNFEAAHQDFETAINLENRNAKYYHGKGLCYQEEAEEIMKSPNPDTMLEEEKINEAINKF